MPDPVSGYVLVKLVSRCNLACTYCYWFRDGSVYDTPVLMTPDVQRAFVTKLEAHVRKHRVPTFRCIFHGGEPTMFGVPRFEALIERLNGVRERTGCALEYSITTNGVLIDRLWANALKRHNVRVAVSIDGPAPIHDRRRPTLSSRASHADTVRGYRILQDTELTPAIIAVADPTSDPRVVLDYLVRDLGSSFCDILAPDMSFDDVVEPIGDYYVTLFDHWYDNYMERGVDVRFLSGLIRGVLGLPPSTDSYGYGPVHTISLATDGTLEPLDVLKIAGNGSTQTNTNIRTHNFEDVRSEPAWKEAYERSLQLCAQCEACRHRKACGGGHLSQRWSKANGYDNPSVYCQDFLQIFDHVATRVLSDVKVKKRRRRSAAS